MFSAIVTAFVTLSANALKLSHSQVTNRLLMELIALQRVAITSGSIDQVDPSPLSADSPPNSTTNITDYWINGLWFTSLALALSAALVALLVRQWVQAYEAPSLHGTAKARAEVRGFRYYGIEKWHVPLIVGLLPTLLHLSLFLFFAGLVVFLFTLNHIIACVITGIVSTVLIAYVITNLLPAWDASCPYKTPLSEYASSIGHALIAGYSWIWTDSYWTQRVLALLLLSLYAPLSLAIRLPWYLLTYSTNSDDGFVSFWFEPISFVAYRMKLAQPRSLRDKEAKIITSKRRALHQHMFTWLMRTSPNPSTRSIATQCLSLDPRDVRKLQPPYTSAIEWDRLCLRSLSAVVTHPNMTLSTRSFGVYADMLGLRADSLKAIASKLLSAHQHSKISGVQLVEEQSYDLSSYIDWSHMYYLRAYLEFGDLLSTTFLRRFCLHALYHATPTSPAELAPLLSIDFSPLFQAMRIVGVGAVYPTPEAVRRLLSWLPTPNQADSLVLTTPEAPELELLLNVGRFLLGVAGMEFSDAFKDAGCLRFWRRVFELHHRVISPHMADTFKKMLIHYVNHIKQCAEESQQREEHLSYLFDNLDTLCLWTAGCQNTYAGVPTFIHDMMVMDEENSAWRNVQDTLLSLFPTEQAKGKGTTFLVSLVRTISLCLHLI